MVNKDTRHFGDTFLAGGDNSAVTCDNIIVPVDDDGIDKAEFTKR